MFWQIVLLSALLGAPAFATVTVTTTTVAPGATTAAGGGANTTAIPRCSDASGNLLPTAQSCSDDNNDCASVFKTAAVASPGSRDPNCDVPLLADTAMKCSKTCAICCENPNYSCGDAPGYEALCPTWKNTCSVNITSVRDQMALRCPGTCGLCMQGSCKDTMADCSKMAILCNDITAGPIWQQQCARTCGTCTKTPTSPNPSVPSPPTTGNCADKLKSCASNAAQCNNPKYSAFLATNCPRTCGKCGGVVSPGAGTGAGAGGCADSRSCAAFVSKGFCTKTFYTIEFRRKTCGRSCNLC